MVREGWLKHGRGHGEGRGREPFVPVSWDQALDLVAGELARVRREHGHAAIMGGSQGWSSAGIFHEARVQLHRFLAAGGGFVDSGDQLQLRHRADLPAAHPRQRAGGDRAADLVVVDRAARQADGAVRRRQSEEHAGHQGRLRVALHRAAGSPSSRAPASRSSTSARSARTARRRSRPEWIPIRPNTDTAMLLALTHTLVSEGLHDQEFLASYCVGFERVLPYLMGETDGQPKDADWAAAITGVPAETIRALARRMAATRTMMTASWSLQRADHGEQPYWAVVLLASALGQIGLPGGGFGFGYGSGAGIADAAAVVRGAGDGRHQESDQRHDPGGAHLRLPAASRRAVTTSTASAAPIPTSGWSIGPAAIRSTIIRTPTSCAAPGRSPETIVVHEPWWTATARHADIVLPATTSLERNDIGGARARPVHHRDAAGDRAGRRGAQRLRRSSASLAQRLGLPRPTRRAATRWPGCGISTSSCAQRRHQRRGDAGLRHVLGRAAIWKFRRPPTNT